MVRKSLIAIALLAIATPLAAQNEEEQWVWTSDRPDARAPLGVMGTTTLDVGQVELSYQLIQRNSRGVWFGKDSLDLATTLQLYEVAPITLSDLRHTFGIAYGVSDNLTLRARGQFAVMEREQLRDDGVFFITSANALGDIEADATLNLLRQGPYRMDVNIGGSVPIGKTTVWAETPYSTPGDDPMPYDMRGGSGSFGLFGNVSFDAQNETGSVGAQFGMRTFLNENSRGYTEGDSWHLDAWAALNLNQNFSLSGGFRWEQWANIDGADASLAAITMRDPMNHGVFLAGQRGIFPVGVNFVMPDGSKLAGHRLSFETQFALHHDYDGPQIGLDWGINLGWSAPF